VLANAIKVLLLLMTCIAAVRFNWYRAPG